MTQETTKQDAVKDVPAEAAATPSKELDAEQAQGVGGGTDVCNIAETTGQIGQAYDNLVDATSHIIERVANAVK